MSKGVGTILVSAFNLINGERQGDYGDPRESFERIARFWSVYLGHEVSGKDVAMMMVLLKMSREMSGHKPDNLLDMAGYVGLAEYIEGEYEERGKKANEFWTAPIQDTMYESYEAWVKKHAEEIKK